MLLNPFLFGEFLPFKVLIWIRIWCFLDGQIPELDPFVFEAETLYIYHCIASNKINILGSWKFGSAKVN